MQPFYCMMTVGRVRASPPLILAGTCYRQHMPPDPPPYILTDHGIRLAIRATPKASRSAIGAVVVMADGRAALSVRVAAPPVEGAANAALVALLAKALGVRKGDVTIATGDTSRLKIVEIRGDGPDIALRLGQMLAG